MINPIVRVVMMQVNEGLTLQRWLDHYSNLFGWKNLTIFDNGSVDTLTLSLLQSAAAAGADVRLGFDSRSDFDNKGAHFTNVIRSWDHEGGYDFALPVDCDEILATFTDNGLTMDRDAVLAEMFRLIGTKEALRMDMSLFNVPGKKGWFCPDRHFVKSFLAAGSIQSLDHGFHGAQSALAEGYRTTRLTYLHFHNKPLAVAQEAARRKLGPRVDLNDPVAVASHYAPGKPGSHLVPILTMTEQKYAARYDGQVRVFVPDRPDARNIVMHESGRPEMWCGEEYLHLNPDVSERYELGSLHHWLRYGYKEGRRIS